MPRPRDGDRSTLREACYRRLSPAGAPLDGVRVSPLNGLAMHARYVPSIAAARSLSCTLTVPMVSAREQDMHRETHTPAQSLRSSLLGSYAATSTPSTRPAALAFAHGPCVVENFATVTRRSERIEWSTARGQHVNEGNRTPSRRGRRPTSDAILDEQSRQRGDKEPAQKYAPAVV